MTSIKRSSPGAIAEPQTPTSSLLPRRNATLVTAKDRGHGDSAKLQGPAALTPEQLCQHVILATPRSLEEALKEAERAEEVLCPAPGQTTHPSVREADCYEEVRWARSPPQQRRQRPPPEQHGRCYRCDEPGHLARDCPAPALKHQPPRPSGNDNRDGAVRKPLSQEPILLNQEQPALPETSSVPIAKPASTGKSSPAPVRHAHLSQPASPSVETAGAVRELWRRSCSGLDPHQCQQLERLLEDNADLFAAHDEECTQTDLVQHTIDTVRKKNGEWRFCVDYRRLSAVTHKDAYPLPHIDEALDHIAGSSWFCSLDL
ncbi:hypothetical protein AAFF_G00343550 [Aldrovandia affinis]|uniref:CCHC-type domain-containing protein n=1 Tax=Aldrovandia affinis TaxID=143900 RepID=A0AAD7SKF8_9TELE|nr:hypothetical protein AAFF_G00343550 [Aldrovandia affinis]